MKHSAQESTLTENAIILDESSYRKIDARHSNSEDLPNDPAVLRARPDRIT